ncbi:protein kinase domain-containing protein [Rhodococcus koreensis]
MAEGDPLETQRGVPTRGTAELSAAGFDDAEEIGRGGFGVVYRCRQADLDRTVAVKVLTAALDEENTARFFRERRAMGRLAGHPNIVGVLQVGTTGGGRPYIVMQYHPQDSLQTRIRERGPLGLEEVLRLGVKMAGALETAHRIGILHRDVKPANILLTDYGEPALTDFGIAHIAGGFETATGTVSGSPAFTAPEVLRGDPPSPASDLYGLGATLFCAVTGHAAFERRSGEQVIAQFQRITTQPVPDLREKGIPDDVCAVVEHAMAADPGNRPSAAGLGNELRQIQRRHGFPVDEMALRPEAGAPAQRSDPVHAVHHAAETAPGGSAPWGAADRQQPVPGRGPGNEISTPITIRSPAGKLPLELTSFIGRRHDLTEAKRLLSTSRLVTLTGMGGVGKTRLALRVAADTARAFDDGVWLIELGELRDASLLVDVMAASLRLRDRSTRPVQDVVVEFLTARRLLLVLDNCEHLVDAVADLAETLLRSCPRLRILATSREALGIDGEAALRVPPLTVPDPDRSPSLKGLPRYDAVTLFAERAAAAVPDFTLTEDNKGAVAQICRRLDGVPLPLELAAARLRALSPQQILERLTDRYALLTRGSRDAPTRQQTLRVCIDWSHELCTPREQQVWGRLSVFSGGFELDAVEGICAEDMTPDDVLDAVTSLVDKSILIREEHRGLVRFRLLETLREYGRDKMQETYRYEILRRRHRDWFQQLAVRAEAEWISARQVAWIARLEREQPNLREAMEFCLTEPGEAEAGLQIAAALYQFWFARGLLSEGRHWLDRALACHGGEPTRARLGVLYASTVLSGMQGDLPAATKRAEQCRELADQLGGVSMRALATHAAGTVALYGGDLTRAVACFDDASAVFRADGDLLRQIQALVGLAFACGLRGDTIRADAAHEEVLALTAPRGESLCRAYSLCTLGRVVWKQNHQRGVGLLKESLRLMRKVDDPLGSARCVEALAWIAADEHNARRATVLMGAAEALWRAVGTSSGIYPNMLAYHEECERSTRRALGEREFEAAFRHGKALSFEDIVAYALDERPPAVAQPARTATTLTKRERQVANLVAQGLTNKAIATKLVISQRTAQGHVEHVLAKLGFTSRAQIAAWVVEQAQAEPI